MIWTLLQTRKSGRYQYLMQTEFALRNIYYLPLNMEDPLLNIAYNPELLQFS